MTQGRWHQVGIALLTLGAVVMLIGFFPGITGLEASSGFGVVQILTILFGVSVMMLGAYIFVQTVLYPGQRHTLWQQIGVRLSMTGLLGMAASGLADVLGFGSNAPAMGETRPTVGVYQAVGMIGCFFIAALGILIFALTGRRDDLPEEDTQTDNPPTP